MPANAQERVNKSGTVDGGASGGASGGGGSDGANPEGMAAFLGRMAATCDLAAAANMDAEAQMAWLQRHLPVGAGGPPHEGAGAVAAFRGGRAEGALLEEFDGWLAKPQLGRHMLLKLGPGLGKTAFAGALLAERREVVKVRGCCVR